MSDEGNTSSKVWILVLLVCSASLMSRIFR